jgi:hypothetical protein
MKYRVSYVIEAENIERAISDLTYPIDRNGYGLDDGRDMSAITSVEVEEWDV